MRKSSMVYEVSCLYDLLNVERGADKSYAGNTYKVITNWKLINTALHQLNDYSFIGDSVNNIFCLGANFLATTETTSILSSEYDKFINLLNIVKSKCKAIIDFCDYNDSSERVELYMKLPNDINDLKALSDLISSVNCSFNYCPVLSDKVGRVKFDRVEEGSSWFVFALELCGTITASAKALECIANFIYKCNEIRLQNVNIDEKKLDVMLKRGKVEEVEYEKFMKNYNKSLEDELRDSCIKKFKELQISDDITPEQEVKIVHSMTTLIEVLEQGTEFYPSSSSDESIQKLFPKQEEFKKIDTVKHFLENKNEDK